MNKAVAMGTVSGREAPPRAAYRVRDFCQAIGISRATAYNYMKDGRLRWVRVAGIRLIPAEAVQEFLRGETEAERAV